MKRYRTFIFDNDELLYVLITKQYDGEIVKDFDLYYMGNQKECILDVLRRFGSKSINYSSLIENFVTTDCHASNNVLRYSRNLLDTKSLNITRFRDKTLHFLVSQFESDWGVVNWNGFRRKENKNAKKKPSD
jgi:hypothetical protein